MRSIKLVLCIFIILYLSLSFVLAYDLKDVIYEGCYDPLDISKALSKIHITDWQNMSLEQLRKIWPTELAYKECNEGRCECVWSMDRIIKGKCQCCALFNFDIQGTKTEPLTEKLGSFIIYYVNATREELIANTKIFVHALGYNDNVLNKIGLDNDQFFSWEATDVVGSINLRINEIDNKWVLYLYCSQHNIQ